MIFVPYGKADEILFRNLSLERQSARTLSVGCEAGGRMGQRWIETLT